MNIDVFTFITACAILIMFYCLWLTLKLKSSIPGGLVGKKWGMLTALVSLFTLGYLATPFFNQLPEDMLRLIVALIFLFGAIYVVITVKLIHTVITELME
ncbi:hypothetical protein [Sulfuriflexus sp.]|uniref:hypothetical protein n=1 Tax=Sulfuriflexus sp. TaxID=2015443 RepID=UPI0028CDA513|nr:hypothetical protein [Sulfuriflexus sp.]MDT8403361.1 hypothetical protein [Sulfuriflexus sp.]